MLKCEKSYFFLTPHENDCYTSFNDYPKNSA